MQQPHEEWDDCVARQAREREQRERGENEKLQQVAAGLLALRTEKLRLEVLQAEAEGGRHLEARRLALHAQFNVDVKTVFVGIVGDQFVHRAIAGGHEGRLLVLRDVSNHIPFQVDGIYHMRGGAMYRAAGAATLPVAHELPVIITSFEMPPLPGGWPDINQVFRWKIRLAVAAAASQAVVPVL
jgi:hypothetical protein